MPTRFRRIIDKVRVTIRVRPGARRAAVGGEYDGALVVAVREPAVDGRATEAALTALATAIGLPRRSLRLVSGASHRTKVVEIDGDEAAITVEMARLRGA